MSHLVPSARAGEAAPSATDPLGIALRAGIVVLALATAYIHLTLGSMLFLANAAGFAVLAVAMVVPIDLASRYRWLIRAALATFTAATILGWLMVGPRFDLAYIAKGIELALIGLLIVEMVRYDGGPLNVLRLGIDLLKRIVRTPFRRGSAA